MEGFLYLYKTTIKNRIIKALKRPISYAFLLLFGWYGFSMVFGIGQLVKVFQMDKPEGFAAMLTLIMFYLIPGNLVAYTKRKGLLFKPSEVQFVFTAPVNPKQVLLFAQVKGIALGILLGIWMLLIGIIYCKIPVVTMMIYFLFSVIIENILEASVMIILYGNESIPEHIISKLPIVMYGIMIIFAVSGFVFALVNGMSMDSLKEYLSIEWLQCVPLIGWYIAIIRLIIIGPTVLNVVCTILFCLTAIGLTYYAYRMKCQGEFYEDAMKFANDYQEARKKSKRGEVARIGKKKKYAKATVEYKGGFAKAIFYRQLLEYKKNKFFIFGGNTLMALAAGIGIVIFAHFNPAVVKKMEFVLLGVSAYITILFSGYATKWSKELENPYTFLIPDNPFRKVWYATLIEHIRAFVDGCLIAIPTAIYFRLNLFHVILIIIIYVCLQANKIYAEMFSQYLVGQTLGTFGKTLLKSIIQMTIMTISIVAGIFSGIILGEEIAFVVLLLVTVCLTIVITIGAVTLFDKMETVN